MPSSASPRTDELRERNRRRRRHDEQLRTLIARELNAKDVFLELACADVGTACELLRPVWEQTRGRDGYVSGRARSGIVAVP
jgi:hypothetical protein